MSGSIFTPEERTRLRDSLLEHAGNDGRISGAAITGSGASSGEDKWSDIDLAFGIRAGADRQAVLADWTTRMYQQHGALHHLDMIFGPWTYRVFLLSNTLQVDIAFVTETEFRPLAPTFRLVFGKAMEPQHGSPPPAEAVIGMAWLHALHARTCIARGQLWQAEYMVSGVRDNALTLACIRHGLPAVYGKGFDQLPQEVIAQFQDSLVRHLDTAELSRVFQSVVRSLVSEIREANAELASRLQDALLLLGE